MSLYTSCISARGLQHSYLKPIYFGKIRLDFDTGKFLTADRHFTESNSNIPGWLLFFCESSPHVTPLSRHHTSRSKVPHRKAELIDDGCESHWNEDKYRDSVHWSPGHLAVSRYLDVHSR